MTEVIITPGNIKVDLVNYDDIFSYKHMEFWGWNI